MEVLVRVDRLVQIARVRGWRGGVGKLYGIEAVANKQIAQMSRVDWAD